MVYYSFLTMNKHLVAETSKQKQSCHFHSQTLSAENLKWRQFACKIVIFSKDNQTASLKTWLETWDVTLRCIDFTTILSHLFHILRHCFKYRLLPYSTMNVVVFLNFKLVNDIFVLLIYVMEFLPLCAIYPTYFDIPDFFRCSIIYLIAGVIVKLNSCCKKKTTTTQIWKKMFTIWICVLQIV